MAAVCSTAAKLKSPVIIRWGQEMDETDSQFSWSHWQGADYVKAYRRMVDVCKVHLKTAKYMWSPKGNEGLQAFIPAMMSSISSGSRSLAWSNTTGTRLAVTRRLPST